MPTILIVEDDVGLVEMLEMVLKPAGYDIQSCTDGLKALYTISSVKPDLVILDLMMPWASGDAVLGFMHCTDELKHIPVLVMSAHPDGEQIAAQLNATGFLKKPVDMRTFAQTVGTMLAVKPA